MKQTEAIEHLEHLLLACQKIKSNIEEVNLPDASPTVVAELKALTSPTTCDNDLPFMPTLLQVLDNYKQTGKLEAIAFFNLMFLANRDRAVTFIVTLRGFKPLPQPDIQWVIRGWD